MLFYLIRHGETEWNIAGRLQGATHHPRLTPRGIDQAKSLAERLVGLDIGHIYSSPLLRARETAKILGGRLGLGITDDVGLRERSFGSLEGKTLPEIDLPAAIGFNQLAYSDCLVAGGPATGIEPMAEAVDRLQATIRAIVIQRSDSLLFISHGAVITGLLRRLHPDQPPVHNCEAVSMRYCTTRHNFKIVCRFGTTMR